MAQRTITFDRLDSGELVALLSRDGRSVAAIVHPRHDELDTEIPVRRWSLCGDVDPHNRPQGTAPNVATACGEAAEALGEYLGLDIDGWSVTG